MALLLSVALTAGTCLPAMAAELPEIQTEEASGIASTEFEQAAEVEPAEDSDEAAVTETPEDTAAEDTTVTMDVRGTEAADDAITSEAAETAGDAITSEVAETVPEEETETVEEPKGGVEPEGVELSEGSDLSESSESGDPEADAAWLNDYDYCMTELNDGTQAVLLQQYLGEDSEIEVPGSVQIDGVTYPVTAENSWGWQNGITGFTAGEGFIFPENSQHFFSGKSRLSSVDLSRADTSRTTSMYGMFSNCSS